ncbi:MAG: aminotransferase class I/II-fold pyridoxal phosphate-dependent enzyme [Planctomycetota bacterium]
MLASEIQSAIETKLKEVAAQRGFATYQGDCCEELERRVAELVQQKFCLLTSSGSSAMEIALRATGIRTGDEVLLSAYDYPGNFWAIERCAARPTLVDVATNSWSLDINKLESALEASPNCKVAIVSHLHGQLQNIPKLRSLFQSRNIRLIEDCCQVIGASQVTDANEGTQESIVGCLADFTILSFGGSKVLSAGRGGALLCSSEELAQKSKIAAGAGSGPYGLSEIQAALVLAQLPFLTRMNELCRDFFDELRTFMEEDSTNHGWIFPVDLQGREAKTGIYQFGLLLQNTDRTLESVLDSASHRLGIGTGFPGFHRRSKRRCHLPIALSATSGIAARTAVIHHRTALDEQITTSQMAEHLGQLLLK